MTSALDSVLNNRSLDSFITDSANSASALFGGKKMTVNGLNAYTVSSLHAADGYMLTMRRSKLALRRQESRLTLSFSRFSSTGKAYGDPKVETIFEMFRRITGGQVGIVSKAYIADATPAAVCVHTSQRSQYTTVIEQYLTGVSSNYSWFPWEGVDLLFGGGGENFLPGPGNGNASQFDRWAEHGYQVGYTQTDLEAFDNAQRALAIFTQGNLSTWLDKNVYPDSLKFAVTAQGEEGA